MIEKGDWTATYFAANDKSGRMPRRLYFSA